MRRRTNHALLVLTSVALASGVAMFAIGSGWNRWATIAHGAVGLAVVALVPWKSAISRRGLRRRGAHRALPSLVLALGAVAALVTGFAHRTGLRELGPVLVMQVHVTAAVVVALLGAWHVRTRPAPLRPVDVSRRAALEAAALGAGAALATVALPHAGHPVTRSLERGSFEPSAMPVTQWLDDEVARLDREVWRLRAGGRAWRIDELEGLGLDERVARLDCTGGWYASQRWAGLPLDRLLTEVDDGGGRSIVVRSATGYVRRFPRRDAPALLLATRIDGVPLSAGHGAPARLVAPGRRGFWWVKWVVAVDVDDRPWWWQSPFPLD